MEWEVGGRLSSHWGHVYVSVLFYQFDLHLIPHCICKSVLCLLIAALKIGSLISSTKEGKVTNKRGKEQREFWGSTQTVSKCLLVVSYRTLCNSPHRFAEVHTKWRTSYMLLYTQLIKCKVRKGYHGFIWYTLSLLALTKIEVDCP